MMMIPAWLLVAPHAGHSIADLGTDGADVGAVGELIVARHGSASFLAGAAELGAGAARDHVIGRTA